MKVYLNGKLQDEDFNINKLVKFMLKLNCDGKVIRMSECDDVAKITIEKIDEIK